MMSLDFLMFAAWSWLAVCRCRSLERDRKGFRFSLEFVLFFMCAAYNPGVLKYWCSKALKDGCLEFLGSNLGQYPLSLRLQLSRHTTVWDPPFHRLVSTSALSCTYTDKLDGRTCPRHLGRYHHSEYLAVVFDLFSETGLWFLRRRKTSSAAQERRMV